MLSYQLKFLDYDHWICFDLNDNQSLIRLLKWINNNYLFSNEGVKLLEVCSQDSINFPDHINKFLKVIECPYDYKTGIGAAITWIVNRSVDKKYQLWQSLKSLSSSFNNPDFHLKINEIMTLTGIVPSSDPKTNIRALNATLQSILNYDIHKKDQGLLENDDPNITKISQDNVITKSTEIARMIFLKDLKRLQNNVNALIVRIQRFNLKPKTNTSLGEVGY